MTTQIESSQSPHVADLSALSPSYPGTQHNALPSVSGGNVQEHPSFVSPAALSTDTFSILDDYAANPRFLELQDELRSLLFTGANSAAPTRYPTPTPDEGATVDSQTASSQKSSQRALLDSLQTNLPEIPLLRKLKYLQIWTSECAPWLDMFDTSRHFGIHVTALASSSPAVLYAMLALSARQSERKFPKLSSPSNQDSLAFYQESITALTPILSIPSTEASSRRDRDGRSEPVLVTACILACLEMFSVSPREWRKHLAGCAALFEATSVHGFSGGLLQAVFWCYARMDLCSAIMSDGSEATVLRTGSWVGDYAATAVDSTQLENSSLNAVKQFRTSTRFLSAGRLVGDMHANYAVYLCAQTYDLLTSRTRALEWNDTNGCTGLAFETRWRKLWDELQTWYAERPREFIPLHLAQSTSVDDGMDGRWPALFFVHWGAISATQLYHTACITMLEIAPSSLPTLDGHSGTNSSPDEPSSEHNSNGQRSRQDFSTLYHARRVVGISLSNPHRGCLNNAIQPLYVAGKLFSHYAEHRTIVNLLINIERTTGWGAIWRVRDLESAWGYEKGHFDAMIKSTEARKSTG